METEGIHDTPYHISHHIAYNIAILSLSNFDFQNVITNINTRLVQLVRIRLEYECHLKPN